MSSERKVAAVKVARAEKANNPAKIAEARRELAALSIEDAIERALAASPPLSIAQKKRIAALLRTGGQS